MEIRPEEEMAELAKDAEAIGNNVMTFFEEFEKYVAEIKAPLDQVSSGITNAKLQAGGDKEDGNKKKLLELEKTIKKATNKLNELNEMNAAMRKTEPEKIKEKVNELVKKSEKLKTAVKSAGGDQSGGGEKGSAVVQKTKELQSAADAVKNIMEEILKEIHEQKNVALRVVDKINDADFQILKSLRDKPEDDLKKILGDGVLENPSKSREKAEEILLPFHNARCCEKIVVRLCEEVKKMAEEPPAAAINKNISKKFTGNDVENILKAQFFSFATAAVWLFYISFLFCIITPCM